MKPFAAEVALAISMLGTPEAPHPNDALVRETICMARNIYHESRGEPPQGQAAVAYVVLNRVKDADFPKTPCAVIDQPGQFSWTSGKRNAMPGEWEAYTEAMQIAVEAMAGELPNPIANATYFHAARMGTPGWTRRFDTVRVIGNHKFLADAS